MLFARSLNPSYIIFELRISARLCLVLTFIRPPVTPGGFAADTPNDRIWEAVGSLTNLLPFGPVEGDINGPKSRLMLLTALTGLTKIGEQAAAAVAADSTASADALVQSIRVVS
jgi:hypothetical protein